MLTRAPVVVESLEEPPGQGGLGTRKSEAEGFRVAPQAFEFCRDNRMFVFTIPSVRYVMRFYQKIGMRPVEGCRFKFEPEDPEEAQLFIVDSEAQLSTVIDNLTRLVRGS